MMICSGLARYGHLIEVTIGADDGLRRTVWRFDVSIGIAPRDWRLRLWLYQNEARRSPRHKWRPMDGARGYDRGADSIARRANLKSEDVPLPPEVAAAALHEFAERVEVAV